MTTPFRRKATLGRSGHHGGGPGDEERTEPCGGSGATTPVLSMRNVTKSFGAARALDGVALTVLPGEIHGLLGENGSGKSTLIKILSGFHAPEPGGELEVNGRRVDLPLASGQFRAVGFSFVHQDLGLVPELSVVENLFVDDIVARHGAYISWKAERRRAARIFEQYGLQLDPAMQVERLSEADRALLAIVRAIVASRRQASEHGDRCLLVLDEPTVFLPQAGKEQLFATLRSIVANGAAAAILVSHDLDEVREVTDRVTVLRDGKVAGVVKTRDASVPELVSLIVGRELDLLERHQPPTVPRDDEYHVRDLTAAGVDDVNFDIRRGEILGLTGLMGSGFEEIPYLLFGARKALAGTLETPERRLALKSMSPQRALQAHIALVPADRQQFGCVGSLSVGENITLPTLDSFRRVYGLSRKAMDERVRGLVEAFDVRPPEPRGLYQSLSGGNQQKAMMAKWLSTNPRLMLLHEPTQGVDIGARAQIFGMLRAAVDDGAAMVCASSDYEQLMAICDRVLIFSRRRTVAELVGLDATKERIAHAVYSSGG